jgi:hypothetical protein
MVSQVSYSFIFNLTNHRVLVLQKLLCVFGISVVSVGVWKRKYDASHAHNCTHVWIYKKERQSKPDVIPEIQNCQKFICFNYDDIKRKYILCKHRHSFSPYFRKK